MSLNAYEIEIQVKPRGGEAKIVKRVEHAHSTMDAIQMAIFNAGVQYAGMEMTLLHVGPPTEELLSSSISKLLEGEIRKMTNE